MVLLLVVYASLSNRQLDCRLLPTRHETSDARMAEHYDRSADSVRRTNSPMPSRFRRRLPRSQARRPAAQTLETREGKVNNRPDYLDNDPLIHWQSQEEFFKDILTPRPPVGPDDAKNHCHNCGCEIEKTGTLARCNECNVKHAAKANTTIS